ncbi:MAG: lytic transglycosylase domain-containing protein [Brevundimonas sp.]|uniref:lytic transglycosylase domain-containing protein n=1 Tax=Brevundimonas sp. TaxID=1871086 RepID=UPI002488E6AC|nr:lytic transglycosylase domain-containing protein [Brevundimonas sp.]MDI1326972.1 lytic transglycosylase domain-containing protein [Brevundimonas sp.]
MVKLIWMAAAALAVATPASAQQADWSRAGGDLFGRPVVEPAAAEPLDREEIPRLESLNQPFQAAIDAAALAHGIDPKLLHALVVTESAYRADARSPAGAGGLTQLMPGTAAELGVENRFDPVENLRGGADYLARQIRRFGDLRLALAAYNAGPARVARLGRIPDIAETQFYVATVVDCYLALTAGQGVTNSRQCRPRGAGR